MSASSLQCVESACLTEGAAAAALQTQDGLAVSGRHAQTWPPGPQRVAGGTMTATLRTLPLGVLWTRFLNREYL